MRNSPPHPSSSPTRSTEDTPRQGNESEKTLRPPKSPVVTITSALLPKVVRYVDNAAFHKEDARDRILNAPFPTATQSRRGRPTSSPHPTCLSSGPLLSREQEQYLFLKMNYLKHLAGESIKQLGDLPAPPGRAAEIHHLLKEAAETKDRIVLANVRLVLKEANLPKLRSLEFEDLAGEGFVNLVMSSVESFDCSRGIKFSTYAVTSLKRHYLRLRERNKVWERSGTILDSSVNQGVDERSSVSRDLRDRAALAHGTAEILALLPPREAQAIRLRFLEERQFKSVGAELGVTTQRAAQIVARGLKFVRSLGLKNPMDDLL